MLQFKSFIAETFNTKPAPFKKRRSDGGTVEYIFKIDDVTYDVLFDARAPTSFDGIPTAWDVTFMSQKGQGFGSERTIKLSGTGNQFKVLNTVMEIIQKFVKEKKSVQRILFSAAKDAFGTGSESDARSKVYRRLIQKKLSSLPGKWKAREKDTNRDIKFTLERHK